MKWTNKKVILVFFSLIILGAFVLSLNIFCAEHLKNFYKFSNYEQCSQGVSSFWDRLFSRGYKEIRTDSGLKLVFLYDKRLPSIQYRIFFPVAGADYDLSGKSGLSVLTAYLSEQGAGGLSSEALQEQLNQLGTELDISVSRQTLSISLSGLSWHGKELWELFQKVIAEPNFQEEELKILRNRFLEKRSESLDRPSFVAISEWRKDLFPGSVGQDASGNLLSLSQISLQDIKNFYNSRYLEGGAVLTVMGQYDKKLKQKIISFFNDRFSKRSHLVTDSSSFDLGSAKFTLLTNEELVQAEVVMGYTMESFPVNDPKKILSYKLANTVLGEGGMTSHLFTELREKRGLTYATYSNVSFEKYYGLFGISGSTKTESVREFLEQTLVILKNFREKGIKQEELQRARQYLKSNHLSRTETPESQLLLRIYYEDYLGVDSSFLDNYLNILDSISLSEVNQIIQDLILPKALKILVYGHPSLKSQLQGLEGFPPIELVSFKDRFAEELKYKSEK